MGKGVLDTVGAWVGFVSECVGECLVNGICIWVCCCSDEGFWVGFKVLEGRWYGEGWSMAGRWYGRCARWMRWGYGNFVVWTLCGMNGS